MSWIAVGAYFGGKVLQGQNDKGVAKKQSALIRDKDTYQKQRTAEAQKAISEYLARRENPAMDAEKDQVRGELRQNMQDTVGAVEKFAAPQITAGKLSNAYADRVAGNRASNAARVGRDIDRLTIIGTPAQVALRDAQQLGRSALTAGANYDAARNVGDAYVSAAERVRPNPWLTMLSEGMQAYGMGKMVGKVGAPAAKAPVGGVNGLALNGNFNTTGLA